MKNRYYILICFFLLGCNPEYVSKSPNLGYISLGINSLVRNGMDMNFNSQTNSTFKIIPRDTIDLSFVITAKYTYETVQIDSIVAIPIFEEAYSEHQEVVDLFQDKLSFTVIPELPTGNQNSFENIRLILPDFNLNSEEYRHLSVNWSFTLYSSHTEQITTNDRALEPSTADVGLEIENSYTYHKFKLYNNYVGKDVEDTTGLGYDPFKQIAVNDLCAIYSRQDVVCANDNASGYLINLTYNEEINTASEVFIPAFGLGVNFTNTTRLYISDENAFVWDRLHLMEKYYDRLADGARQVIDVEIGQEVFIITNKDNKVALRVVNIVVDGLLSYVEFETAINNADLYDHNN